MSTGALDPSWTPDVGSQALFAEKTWFSGLFLLALAYGVIITLSIQCFAYLYRSMNANNKREKWFWIGVVFLLLVCATVFSVGGEKINEYAFIDYRNFPGGPSAFEVAFFDLPVNAAADVFWVIALWTCDGILLWRVFVIYSTCRFPIWIVMAIPILAYLGTIAMGILWAIQICNPTFSPWSATTNFTAPYIALSLALNIVLSIALVLRLILHRWRMRRVMGHSHGADYLGVVSMIVESAIVYSTFSLLSLVTFLINHPVQNVFDQKKSLTDGCCIQIIATLMIIFRVVSGTAWSADTASMLTSTLPRTTQDGNNVRLGNISFAKASGTTLKPSIISNVSKVTESVILEESIGDEEYNKEQAPA
ncbi:hypothetical protein BDZ97DRAFT_1667601 [Flammula alnicola]|nr:hypothetical protein BDZ97DRAFT_1667601 [Flammula alnicola]